MIGSGVATESVLVTGGGSGIGRELVRMFLGDGARVLVASLDQEELDSLASEFASHGSRLATLQCDLSTPGAALNLLAWCDEKRWSIDTVVNNAGFATYAEVVDEDLARVEAMVRLNVIALTQISSLFGGRMKERGSGRILNVGSTAGFQPGPLMSVYYASKAYVLSFSQALHEELRDTGVTVTCLCPGSTATEFAERAGISNSRLFTLTGVASAEDVASYGYAATMRGERIALPGLKNKAHIQALRLLPRSLVTTLARKVQESR